METIANASNVTPITGPTSRLVGVSWSFNRGTSARSAPKQLSLYGLKDLPDGAALLPDLGTYTEGAGCVYVKKIEDIDLDVLRQLIRIAWSRPDDPGA